MVAMMEKLINEKFSHFEDGEKTLKDAARRILQCNGKFTTFCAWSKWRSAVDSHERMKEVFSSMIEGVKGE